MASFVVIYGDPSQAIKQRGFMLAHGATPMPPPPPACPACSQLHQAAAEMEECVALHMAAAIEEFKQDGSPHIRPVLLGAFACMRATVELIHGKNAEFTARANAITAAL